MGYIPTMKNLLVPFCNKNQSLTGETTCRAFQTNMKDPLKEQCHKGFTFNESVSSESFLPLFYVTETCSYRRVTNTSPTADFLSCFVGFLSCFVGFLSCFVGFLS